MCLDELSFVIRPDDALRKVVLTLLVSADNYFLKYSDQEWFQTGADYLEPPSPI